MADPSGPHPPAMKHEELSEASSHDVLETWRGMGKAQEKALLALITEIDSTALFMSEQTGAVTEAFQTLAQTLSGVEESRNSQAQLNAIVHHLQFQDQANQRLEHVKGALTVMVDGLKELDNQTKNRVPSLNPHPTVDMQWLHAIICRYTLKDVRERFMQSLLSEGLLPEAAAAGAAGQKQNDRDGLADGDIELF